MRLATTWERHWSRGLGKVNRLPFGWPCREQARRVPASPTRGNLDSCRRPQGSRCLSLARHATHAVSPRQPCACARRSCHAMPACACLARVRSREERKWKAKGSLQRARVLLIWKTICQPIALRGLHWVQGQCRQTARVHVRAGERAPPEVESSGF